MASRFVPLCLIACCGALLGPTAARAQQEDSNAPPRPVPNLSERLQQFRQDLLGGTQAADEAVVPEDLAPMAPSKPVGAQYTSSVPSAAQVGHDSLGAAAIAVARAGFRRAASRCTAIRTATRAASRLAGGAASGAVGHQSLGTTIGAAKRGRRSLLRLPSRCRHQRLRIRPRSRTTPSARRSKNR